MSLPLYTSSIFLAGIPQKPQLFGASSSGGTITIQAATNESGTEPPDSFKFNMRARHAVTGQEREFEVVDMQYKDGQVVELKLTGFVEVSEGPLYLVAVSCTNRYGTSEESDAQTVSIRFSAGKYAQDAKFYSVPVSQ